MDKGHKIINNLSGKSVEFSWKMRFPSSVLVDNISKENIMIINYELQKVPSRFEYNSGNNSIQVIPKIAYNINQCYFLLAKHNAVIQKNKVATDICVAFRLDSNFELKLYNAKDSRDKLNHIKRILAQDDTKRDISIQFPFVVVANYIENDMIYEGYITLTKEFLSFSVLEFGEKLQNRNNIEIKLKSISEIAIMTIHNMQIITFSQNVYKFVINNTAILKNIIDKINK